MTSELSVRSGSADDLDAILKLFDANVVWLTERGRSDQWGSDPWSSDARKRDFIRTMLENGETLIVQREDLVVGAAIYSPNRIAYAPEIDEPEIYLHLLISDPRERGSGIGSQLIEMVRSETEARGVAVLRVDCWSGGDRRLVRYYQSQGFVPTEEVEVRPGVSVQVFEMRQNPASDKR